MINQKMEDAINKQINNEMYSAYLYMAMAAHADKVGLKGFAHWFMIQYHEEMYHAMKMYEYLQSRGGEIKLTAIAEPPKSWDSPLQMFEDTLEHEQFITKCINDLVDLARAENDKPSEIFYHWYVMEQVEEEDNDNTIIDRLKIIGNKGHALLMLDKELGSRENDVPIDFAKGVSEE